MTVHRAVDQFGINGKTYPAGSFVVFTAQAFRPHVMDMFEPQDHPNVIPYPGAPPTPPYDNAGWTLAFQMGVRFDRVLDSFTGPFEKVREWNVKPSPGRIPAGKPRAYLAKKTTNDAFKAVNRLLKSGDAVFVSNDRSSIVAAAISEAKVKQIAAETGVDFAAFPGTPRSGFVRLRMPRIGLWDQYGGSMPSGWTRWILEQFEFPFQRVFAPELDAGGLNAKYDVLIFVTGAIPASGGDGGGRGGRGGAQAIDPTDVPTEYRPQLGRVSVERTIPQLRTFLDNGGTIVAIGSSAANLAAHLRLPIENHLTENGAALPRSKYFVPGSVLSGRIETTHPVAAGMSERADFFFDNSPVFRFGTDAQKAGVKVIARFDSPAPLRSGWAWGQKYLDGGVIALEAPAGKGRVVLFGPEILHRAQPHGTFKLLFNALY